MMMMQIQMINKKLLIKKISLVKQKKFSKLFKYRRFMGKRNL